MHAGQSKIAANTLASSRELYHVELIGLVGYYQLQAATDSESIMAAVAVMALAKPYFNEPQLELGMAEGYWRLGETDRARTIAERIHREHPRLEEAKALLVKIRTELKHE